MRYCHFGVSPVNYSDSDQSISKWTNFALNSLTFIFQADASMVGYLHTEMVRLLRKFLGKFVKTSVITASKDITKVDYTNPDNQHPDNNLAVGMAARSYLSENPDIPPETVKSFFGLVNV